MRTSREAPALRARRGGELLVCARGAEEVNNGKWRGNESLCTARKWRVGEHNTRQNVTPSTRGAVYQHPNGVA